MSDDKGQSRNGSQTETKREIPDYYSNAVKFISSIYDLTLEFGKRTNPDVEPEPLLIVRMSPQHGKTFSILLTKFVAEYEKNVGEIKLPEDFLKSLESK